MTWSDTDRVMLREFLATETGKNLIQSLQEGIITLLSRATTIEEQALLAREAVGRKDLLTTILANARDLQPNQSTPDFVDTTAGLV